MLQHHKYRQRQSRRGTEWNSLPYLEMYDATAALGALIVPLNFRLAPAELAYILQDSGSTVLLVGEGFCRALRADMAHSLSTVPPRFRGGPRCPRRYAVL